MGASRKLQKNSSTPNPIKTHFIRLIAAEVEFTQLYLKSDIAERIFCPASEGPA